jgi:putative protease
MIHSKTGEEIKDAKGSGHRVAIDLTTDLDLKFGIIMRYLSNDGTTRHPFAQNQADK